MLPGLFHRPFFPPLQFLRSNHPPQFGSRLDADLPAGLQIRGIPSAVLADVGDLDIGESARMANPVRLSHYDIGYVNRIFHFLFSLFLVFVTELRHQ